MTANGFGEKGEAYRLIVNRMCCSSKKTGLALNHGQLSPEVDRPQVLSARHGFVREPGRSVCKIICTSACRTRPAVLDTMLYTTNFTTTDIRTGQSSCANFSTSF